MRPLPFLPALLIALCLHPAGAAETSWQAVLPDGRVTEIVADDGGTRDGWLLQRRQPDGQPDTRFGARGATPFTLGQDHDEPSVLRLDARGRAWVAGASEGPDGQRPVVLRFGDTGLQDRRFGANGRSAVAPGGRPARASDLLPLDEGGAVVAGLVTDAQGTERAAVWRLREDGTLEPTFAGSGAWVDPGGPGADPAGLVRAPDGRFALGLKRYDSTRPMLEVWAWQAGDVPRRVAATAVEPGRADPLRLAWRDGQWAWEAPGQPTAPAAAAPAPVAATEPPRDVPPAAALATPFSERPSASAAAAAAPAPEGQAASAGWWLLLPAGVGALWWWRRRSSDGA